MQFGNFICMNILFPSKFSSIKELLWIDPVCVCDGQQHSNKITFGVDR